MENMMQTQKAKQVIKLSALATEIPSSESMVTVGSMMSKSDEEFEQKFSVGSIAVKVADQYFFLSKQHKVPSTAELVRQNEGQHEGQIVGIPAVVGG